MSIMISLLGVVVGGLVLAMRDWLAILFCPKQPWTCDASPFGWAVIALFGWPLPITLAMLVYQRLHANTDALTLTSEGFVEVSGGRRQSYLWSEVSEFRPSLTGLLGSGVGWDVVTDPGSYKPGVYAECGLRSIYHVSLWDTIRLMNSWRQAALSRSDQQGEE